MQSRITMEKDALENKIQFYITQLNKFKNQFKEFYKKIEDDSFLHGQYKLWQASALRLEPNITSADPGTTLPPLAAEDFIDWHRAIEEITDQYTASLADLTTLINDNKLSLDIKEITASALPENKYFPAYQLLYAQRLQHFLDKIEELKINKNKLKDVYDSTGEFERYDLPLNNMLNTVGTGIHFLMTNGFKNFSTFCSYRLAESELDREIFKTEAALIAEAKAFKQEFKKSNASLVLAQGLFKAEKYKNRCVKAIQKPAENEKRLGL